MQSIIKKVVWACLLIIPFVALYVASGCSDPSHLFSKYCANPLDIFNWKTSGMYFPFIAGKNLIFRLLVEAAFFGWIILALKDTSYRISLRKSPILIAYSIFMLILLAADIFGVDSFRSFWSNFERMEGYVGHIHFFAYFVVLSAMLRSLDDYRKLFKAFIYSNIAVLIFGYGQLLGANGYIFSKLFPSIAAKFSAVFAIHMSENRLDSTLGNSEYFAIYCLMFIFILALMWSQEKEPRTKKWYPVLMVLNLIALFYTGTRGTLIGLAVGALCTFGIMVFRWTDSKWQLLVVGVSTLMYALYVAAGLFIDNGLLSLFSAVSYIYAFILLVAGITTFVKVNDRWRKVGASVFVGIIALILVFEQIKHVSFIQSSPTLARLANISPSDLTGMSRLSIWDISLEAWKEKPILGYGQENFSYIFASKFIPEKMWKLESWYDRSHDVFFDWLVAAGALGLLSYLSLYGVALWVMWRKNDMPFKEQAILTGALAGYFVHNIFVFDNLISYILFFFLLAYIAWRTGFRGDVHGGKTISEDQLAMIWLPIAAIGFIVSAYFLVYRPFLVNRLLVRGIDIQRLVQTVSFADALKIQQASFEQAIGMHILGSTEAREQYLQTAIRMAQVPIPAEVSAEQRQIATQAVSTLLAGARTEIEKSYEANKNDVRMLSLYGMFYNGIGDGVSGEAILSQAHSLAPKKQLISFDLIRAYMLQGKTAQAYDLARSTFTDAPAYPDAVKVYLLSAVYANKYTEANAYVMSMGITPSFDPDVLSALVDTNQVQTAIELLTDLKKTNPEYAAQVDAYIKQLLAKPKK